jgi:hypothetical protein
VGLGGKMHHGVGFGHQRRDQLAVANITFHQPDGVLDVGQ